jgi:hypothetical protein
MGASEALWLYQLKITRGGGGGNEGRRGCFFVLNFCPTTTIPSFFTIRSLSTQAFLLSLFRINLGISEIMMLEKSSNSFSGSKQSKCADVSR